jgi:hypothetical protein
VRALTRAGAILGAIVLSTLAAAPASAALRLFQSPSGNIGCAMSSGAGSVQARCDIARRLWTPPRRPASCPLDFGQGVFVGQTGRGRYTCAGDTVLHQGSHLGFQQSITLGRLRCTSRVTGVSCTNRSTGHGFTISRERVRLF